MERLNLLVLRCRDIERSRAFYEILGLSFTKHAHGSGPEHYAHEDSKGVFELYPSAGAASADETGLGFASPSLQSTWSKLHERGFEPGQIKPRPWGKTFVVRDPDGRRVEVKESVS
jgi:lactoylglutathione lyase